MLRQIALWLLRTLEGSLDTDLKQRLNEYRTKRQNLDADIKHAREVVDGLEKQLAQLQSQRAAVQNQLADAERESSRTEQELEGVLHENEKSNLDGSSDHDVLRGSL